VAKADFEPAIKLLIDIVVTFQPDLEDEAISVSSRYYRVKKAVNVGITTFDDSERHLNTIAFSILGILRTLTENRPQV